MKMHKINTKESAAIPNQYTDGRFSTKEKAEFKLDLSIIGRKVAETIKRNMDEKDKSLARDRKSVCIKYYRLFQEQDY